ncbi:protein phosphatase [Planoprotostelium fungivorum]|uniref:protein-serine/threonine phosphatase n=1 Tax=Planoprotostelium fungivorum TaxID=1890364 RepID=A0A2P6N7C5_9EUKA|nr:protein phosphatase [Planoprotostelium fungivorum]
MEDAHQHILKLRLHPNHAYFGLFDGHLGDQASKWCADFLHIYLDSLKEFTPENIKGACLRADHDLKDHIHQDGCTGVFALLEHVNNPPNPEKPWNILVGNVGDSRAMLARDGKTLVSLSDDHKPNNPEEHKRIIDSGGMVRNNRVNGDLAVSRAFGDFKYKNKPALKAEQQAVTAVPDFISAESVGGNDFLVICCDGLIEVLDNERIVEFISHRLEEEQTDLAVIAGQLCDLVANNGGRDNMSLMIIQFVDGRSYHAPDEFVPVPAAEFENSVNEEGEIEFPRFVENHANLNWEEVLDVYGESIRALLPEKSGHSDHTPSWTSVPVSITPEGSQEAQVEDSSSESDEEQVGRTDPVV